MKRKPVLTKSRITIGIIIAYILVAAFLIINLNNLHEYGLSWDEPTQYTIGWYAVNKLIGNPVALGHRMEGDLVYYGPFFEILNYASTEFLKHNVHLDYAEARHVLVLLIASIGLFFVFLLGRKMFNDRVGIYSVIFLALFPWFIAHSHYNSKDIPVMVFGVVILYFLYSAFKEKSYACATLAGLFLGIGVSTQVTVLRVLLVFFISYLVYLVFGMRIFSDKRWPCYVKRNILLFAIVLGFGLLFAFLSWPALWSNPALLFQSIAYFMSHGWSGNVLYFGQTYSSTSVPWHYAPVFLVMVTPIITLLFFGIGLYSVVKMSWHAKINVFVKKSRSLKENRSIEENRSIKTNVIAGKNRFFECSLLLAWLIIPLLMELSPSVPKYGGIRHFFIVVPALAILAALGFEQVSKRIEEKIKNRLEGKIEKRAKKRAKKRIKGSARQSSSARQSKKSTNDFLYPRVVLMMLVSGILFAEIARIHPFEGSYYNEIVRASIPEHIETKLELEYWGPTYRQGMDWLNLNAVPNSTICVPVADHLIQYYPKREDLRFGCDIECSKNCYLMFITWQHSDLNAVLNQSYSNHLNPSFLNQSSLNQGFLNQISGLVPEFRISRYDSDLMYVYKIR